MALGFPFPAHFMPPRPPPAAPAPIRYANRASTRPIIRPAGPVYRPPVYPRQPDRGFFEMERLRAEAAARAAMNAQMYAQQAALQAQQQAMLPPQQMQTSPAAPGGDLTPAQDNAAAADAASSAADPVAHPHNTKLLLFAGIAVVAGIGGYTLLKKRKSRSSGG